MCANAITPAALYHIRLRVLAAAICLAFLLPVGTNSLFASCGDWLAHSESDVATSGSFGQGDFSAQVPNEAPKPCDGPSCRGNRPFPLQPIPASSLSTSNDVGCPVALVGFSSRYEVGLLCAEYTIGTFSRHNCRIYRPPIL